MDVRFRQWEKSRRDRFNRELQELARCCTENENEKDAAEAEAAALKWSKQLIVQKAIAYIHLLQRTRMPEDVERRIRTVKRQNRKLRMIIRDELGLAEQVSESQLIQLSLKEIRERVAEAASRKKKKEEEEEEVVASAPLVGDDVFVAPVSNCDDHSYSLVVHGQPDVEVVAEETVGGCDDDDDGDAEEDEVEVPLPEEDVQAVEAPAAAAPAPAPVAEPTSSKSSMSVVTSGSTVYAIQPQQQVR